MRAVKLICSAVLAMTAVSLPAMAGEPGPNFHPAPAPQPAPAPHGHSYHQSQHGWGHSQGSGTNTRDLNLQSMHSIHTVQPAPVTTYSYSSGHASSSSYSSASSSSHSYSSTPTRTYTTTTSGCYTPNPCASHHAPPTRTTTTTRTYVRSVPTATPCYTPNPCAAPPAPAVVYHQPAPAPQPEPQIVRYDWLAIEQCRENTIRRLSTSRDGERSYAVCYADLMHLSDYERNSELLERIETASRRACRDQGISSFYSSRARRECRDEATEDAVYAANLPGLVDLYNHREGNYTPNVNVGRPIMN